VGIEGVVVEIQQKNNTHQFHAACIIELFHPLYLSFPRRRRPSHKTLNLNQIEYVAFVKRKQKSE